MGNSGEFCRIRFFLISSTAYIRRIVAISVWRSPETSGVSIIKPDILAALEAGKLDREDLRKCVKRILNVVFQTLSYEDPVCYLEGFQDVKSYLNS